MTAPGRPRRTVLPLKDRDRSTGGRNLMHAGGPLRSNLDEARGLGGYHGAILEAVYGRSDEEFDRIIEYELQLEQLRRSHAFVRKLTPKGRRARNS